MAIAVKTYFTLSGLNILSKKMFKNEDVYWIPKEKWVFENGRYSKKIFIDEDVSRDFKIWKGQPITRIYSMETCMIDLSWITKAKNNGIEVFDVPMIEWVERKKFDSGLYNIFDKIICLNDYCYEVFSYKYKNAVMKSPSFLYERKKISNSKENIIYHQSSVHSKNSFKNTENCLIAFADAGSKKYKLIVTGKLSDYAASMCIDGKNIDYRGIVDEKEIKDIYCRSKYFLCPSTQEGLGLGLYEAKNFGCKVITTNFSPMREAGDYLCRAKIISDGDKFMYPKLRVSSNSISNILIPLLI